MTHPAFVEFGRRPVGAGEIAADLVRIVGGASAIVAAVVFSATDAGVVAFALPGLLLARFVGARPGVDIAASLTILVAAWSNVFDLYTRIWWWDLAVHFVCTGVLAALLQLSFARFGMAADPRSPRFTPRMAVVPIAALGLALSAVWEMVEWIGVTFISDEIFVTYDDTIGDMAVGGLGALLAGILVGYVRVLRPAIEPATPRR